MRPISKTISITPGFTSCSKCRKTIEYNDRAQRLITLENWMGQGELKTTKWQHINCEYYPDGRRRVISHPATHTAIAE